MNGGERLAEVLARHRIGAIFTLCGGHISPILVAAKRRGLRVIDTRGEAAAVFAADAYARLAGQPGVAAVTAGPGVTNSVTALKNAQMAQSPVVLLGGAAATVLRGRGSLQDIDQLAVVRSLVKYHALARRVADLAPALERALFAARDGVPGPVFVECPVDLLYDEATVREWYGSKGGAGGGGLARRAERAYLDWHLKRIFGGSTFDPAESRRAPADLAPDAGAVRAAATILRSAERPVAVLGSQTVLDPATVGEVAAAVGRMGLPVYLSGMARGLLGAEHPLLFRHARRAALKEADAVLLSGVPCDFRLDYGRPIRRDARLLSIHRSARDLRLNRRPTLGAVADPGRFLVALAAELGAPPAAWERQRAALAEREAAREREIDEEASRPVAAGVHPLALLRALDRRLSERSVLVADGGDFVGTAAYSVRPRRPLAWLDPGAYGTLGVGGGFAAGVAAARPEAEIWLLYGDGSLGYSLSEFDTYVRHGMAPIALVGNDAAWAQIARDQVAILGDDVATTLRRSDYEKAAEGLGAAGLRIENADEADRVLGEAQRLASQGRPVLVNAILAASDFRKGSLAM
ncbi:MAG: thiamine pyrophosphate-binding protein [Thermoanaerobaculia bacterium]